MNDSQIKFLSDFYYKAGFAVFVSLVINGAFLKTDIDVQYILAGTVIYIVTSFCGYLILGDLSE